MLSIFDATATDYNSTTWKEQCHASVACTYGLNFGYVCGVAQIVIIFRLIRITFATIARAKQRRKLMRFSKSKTPNRRYQGVASNSRYHYKLHLLLALLVNDILTVLLLFLGQFGQNLESNLKAQLFAYGWMFSCCTGHLAHLAADFNARRMKNATKAVRKNEQVDNSREYDDKVLRNEKRKYLLSTASSVIILHCYWIAFAGFNNNLVSKLA